MAVTLPIRDISFQIESKKADPRSLVNIEQRIAVSKQQNAQEVAQQIAREREINIAEQRQRDLQLQYQRELEAFNLQKKKQEEFEYRRRLRRRRSVKARPLFSQSLEPIGTIEVLPEREGFQGITTKEGLTYQNIKTGQILPIYKISPQEEAKRSLLIKSGFAKESESPKTFIILPPEELKKERPKELKEVLGSPYIIQPSEKQLIIEQQNQIRRNQRDQTKPFRFSFYNTGDYVVGGVSKVERAISDRSKFYRENIYTQQRFKSPPALTKFTTSFITDVALFSAFAPVTTTKAQELSKMFATGDLSLKPEFRPKTKAIVDIYPITRKVSNVKTFSAVKRNEKTVVSFGEQDVFRINKKLNQGFGNVNVLSKEKNIVSSFKYDVYSQSKVVKFPKIERFTTLKITSYITPKNIKSEAIYRNAVLKSTTSPKSKSFFQESLVFVKKKGVTLPSGKRAFQFYASSDIKPTSYGKAVLGNNIIATKFRKTYLFDRFDTSGTIRVSSQGTKSTGTTIQGLGLKTSTVAKSGSNIVGSIQASKKIQERIFSTVPRQASKNIYSTTQTSRSLSSLSRLSVLSRVFSTGESKTRSKQLTPLRTINLEQYRLREDVRLVNDLAPNQSSRSRQSNLTRQIQRPEQETRTRQEQIIKPIQVNKFNPRTIIRPQLKPLTTIKPVPLILRKANVARSRRIIRPKQFRPVYTPSLTASVFNIRSKRKPRSIIGKNTYGYGIRPQLR